jgi:competence protein ComK
MINNYEINNSTLAIIPVGDKVSKIIEEENNFVINKIPTEVVDDSCKFFGSSYLGRFEGTKSLLGVNYKSPIIIEETKEIIFFPTSSPRFNNCFWISLNNIENYSKNEHKTIISFKNGQRIELNISYGSLENQILRATRLESILRKRKLL